jgi:hypothetical protein
LEGHNLEGGALTCSSTMCADEGVVQPGGTLVVFMTVEISQSLGAEKVTNIVKVTGGSAPPASSSEPLTMPNTIEEPSGIFGLADFGFDAYNADGKLDMQAAGHPSSVTTTMNLKSAIVSLFNGAFYRSTSISPPKDLVVDLPPGLIGDPTAASRCTQTQLIGNGRSSETECPPTSRIGTLVVDEEGAVFGSVEPNGSATAIYNMVPEAGYPAQFGFKVLGKVVPIYASLIHTDSGYALRVGTPGILTALYVEGLELTFFGDPEIMDGAPGTSRAFFTNPGNCTAGPLEIKAEADSWTHPGQWTASESSAYPGISGCNLLRFEPSVELQPEVTEAEAPSGYAVNIRLPQNPGDPSGLATPDLKNVTMTLPEGMAIAPGGAYGLTGCEATGLNGIDMPTNLPGGRQQTPTEAGEGEALGPDGLSHLTVGHCPRSAQIGTVRVTTPVLERPLEGHLYVAQPPCGGQGEPECSTASAEQGQLFGLYLEAAGSGVVVKLKGSVSVNPATGQLTARFLENPQFPVSEVALNIEGGERSPLSNPRQCGPTSASGDLMPWSAPMTPDANVISPPFAVDWDGHGGACPLTLPFAPAFTAGVMNVAAGRFSPFITTVTRGERQQDLARVQVTAPAGLLGMLSKVQLCGEPQAQLGTCGEASQVGSASVEVGPGRQPLGVRGKVYITGPYGGAPFGLSVVVPAVAGPFNLGNVVVRARVDVDPHTAAITVTSDPTPQLLDGVPLRIETLNVDLEREGFIFNPTSCTAKQVSATIQAEQGSSASLSVPFAVEDCRALPFAPKFSASTGARTSKHGGVSLAVKIASSSGQANIGKVVALLPKQLPARLTTLQQACPAGVFAQNPAACPTASDVGTVKAVTPALNAPLVGPAYLVSHGGAAFPDLVIILEGQGIRLDLVGNTDIKKGVTTSTFASLPDAPISSFLLRLPAGPHSVLGSNLPARDRGSLCGVKLVMPTTIIGQNGARIKQNTNIAVSGCPKAHAGRSGHRG